MHAEREYQENLSYLAKRRAQRAQDAAYMSAVYGGEMPPDTYVAAEYVNPFANTNPASGAWCPGGYGTQDVFGNSYGTVDAFTHNNAFE